MTSSSSNSSNAPARAIDLGALEQRVYGLEQGLTRLGNETSNSIQNLANSTTQQINAVSTSISKLDSSLQERGKIPWPAMSVGLGVVAILGALVYWPIRESQTRLETALIKVADATPSYKEIDASARRRDDWQRYAEDRFKRVEEDAATLQKAIVPRGEHEEKWRGADLRFADVQRQVDAIKADFSGLYSPRDALTSMQRRIEDLERRLIMSKQGS